MRIATRSLLIAVVLWAVPMLAETGQVSKQALHERLCSDIPPKAAELATLRSAITKAQSAVDAIDFSKIKISYAQGQAMMQGPIKAAHDDIGHADAFAARAETEPSLLYYWHAYTGAVYAKTALTGAGSTLRFAIVNGDQASIDRIAQWRADIDAAVGNLDEALVPTETMIGRLLESVDKCAFGVTYAHKTPTKRLP
jgi:hypothetical protein